MKTIFNLAIAISLVASTLISCQDKTSRGLEAVESPAMVSFMGREGETTVVLNKVHQVVGLLAKAVDEKSDVGYDVQSYKLTIGTVDGENMTFETFDNEEAKLSETSLVALKKVKVGDMVIIENVMVKEKGNTRDPFLAKGAKVTVIEG